MAAKNKAAETVTGSAPAAELKVGDRIKHPWADAIGTITLLKDGRVHCEFCRDGTVTGGIFDPATVKRVD